MATEIYTVVPIIRTLHASVVFGSQIVESGATVHNDLTSRDAEDCHPISAITGLTASLGTKIPDAPADGLQYARKDNAWTEVEASGGASFWTELTGCTRASDKTITTATDLTGSINVGDALKYVISGTTKYGIVTAITSNLITISGETVNDTITTISVGKAGIVSVQTHHILVSGQYADADNSALIASDLLTEIKAPFTGKIISAFGRTTEIDTSAPTLEATFNIVDSSSNSVFTANTQLATADTWYQTEYSNPTYNSFNAGDKIELKVTAATGTANKDAVNLTVIIIMVNTSI